MKNYILKFVMFFLFVHFTNGVFSQQADDIVITNSASDIAGFIKVGDADITKTAFLGKQESLTKKAADELKQQALAKGATVIFVRVNQYIPDTRNYFNKVRMAGELYKKGTSVPNQPPVLPQVDTSNTMVKPIPNNIDFVVTGCAGDAEKQTVTIYFTFSNPRKVNQKISILKSWCCMNRQETRALDYNSNVFMPSTFSLANNILSSGYTTIAMELLTGGNIKGSITFMNILPTVSKLALVNICNTSENWEGRGDSKWGLIEIKNLAISWNNKQAAVPGAVPPNTANTANYLTYNDLISKLSNGENAANKKVILDNIYFETNKDVITDDSKTTLQNVLKLLIKYPRLKITILGHTDNVGRDDDNLSLSISRAHAVVNYLVAKGIDRNRMFYKGFGSTVPLGDNSTEEGKAKNRRTEMEIMEQ